MKQLEYEPRVSRDAGLNEQSSIRKDTRPGADAGFNAEPMYSIDLLSTAFCDRSKNCRLLDFCTKVAMILNAGAFRRLLDAMDRKLSVLGISNA